jgi:hypothetical protein
MKKILQIQGHAVPSIMEWLLHPVVLVGFLLLSLVLALRAEPATGAPAAEEAALSFENVDAGDEAAAMEIYATVRAHFTRITGREVGKLPIRVAMVDHLGSGEASRTAGQVLGVTVHSAGRSLIQISSSQDRTFGRVFAHELVHAFTREAYGQAVNRSLSEGLADYVASLLFSAEVNRDLRAASKAVVRNPRLLPYVNGYNFCLHYAQREGFGDFYASQIGMPDFGFGHLERVWKRQGRA